MYMYIILMQLALLGTGSMRSCTGLMKGMVRLGYLILPLVIFASYSPDQRVKDLLLEQLLLIQQIAGKVIILFCSLDLFT